MYILELAIFSETGGYHRSVKAENEDAVFSVSTDSVVAVAVCDGAGGLCGGGVAAKLVSETVGSELINRFKEFYVSDSVSAKWKIAQKITECLSFYAEQNSLAQSDLACTVMAAAMDIEGRCICFHLGDGIIFRKKKGSACWDVVSSPQNGLKKNTTYLTMNCDLGLRLQYYRWKDPAAERLMLLTDGAAEHLVNRDRKHGWTFANGRDFEIHGIKNYLDGLSPEDDYSGGMIIRK